VVGVIDGTILKAPACSSARDLPVQLHISLGEMLDREVGRSAVTGGHQLLDHGAARERLSQR